MLAKLVSALLFHSSVNLLNPASYARFLLSASNASPHSVKSPLVGSGTEVTVQPANGAGGT